MPQVEASHQRVRISPRAAWQLVGDEAIVLDIASGRAIGLNEVGSFIWRRLADSSLDAIVSEIVKEFDVDETVARDDLTQFIDMFVSQDLLVIE